MAYKYEFPSPDGRLAFVYTIITMRMSHEVHSPTLLDVQTNACVFDPGELWSGGGVEWSEDSNIMRMSMRLYPDGHIPFSLMLDLANDRATLTYNDQAVIEGTVAEVERKMKSTYDTKDLVGNLG